MNGGTGGQEGHQGHRRLDMANNSPFNLSSLVNNPSYDFLNFLTNSEENADSPDSFTTHSESPYSQSNFLTHYTDITSLSSTLNTNTQLSILSLNIQSLPSKYNDLLELISSLSSHHCQPDLICLQEIWSVMDSDHFPLPGYQPLTFKTRTTCQGRGSESMSEQVSLLKSANLNLSLLTNSTNHSSSQSPFLLAKNSPLAHSTDLTLNTQLSLPLNNLTNSTKYCSTLFHQSTSLTKP